MFQLAFLIGFISYVLFFLGIFGLFYKSIIILLTCAFIFACLISFYPQIKDRIRSFSIPKSLFFRFFLGLIVLQAIINLIGALGPELAFDALWYHLTIPKIFLIEHRIFHIQSGLLYYSDMPKLGEMLYSIALSFNSEIIAKVIHFSFGLLILMSIYQFAKKYFNQKIAIVSALIFYTSLAVNWESITAYVDLTRTFFEFLSFWSLIIWIKSKSKKDLIFSAVFLGLAVCTKVLSISSLFIFCPLIIIIIGKKNNLNTTKIVSSTLIFLLITLIIPTPWFIFSYMQTHSPVYPFFSNAYPISTNPNFLNPTNFFSAVWNLFTNAPDPISPIFLATFPLFFVLWKKMNNIVRIFLFYCVVSTVAWYLTPATGGGRFIIPYLPVFSLLSGWSIDSVKKSVRKTFLIFVMFASFISIGYRGIANAKYIPVILGIQSKANFLSKNLNFSFGDFYDTDSYFLHHIKSTDRVFLVGFHNIFYVDFPFTLSKNVPYNFIAVQTENDKYMISGWEKIYRNEHTKVSLYAKDE